MRRPQPRSDKKQWFTNCANCHRLNKMCPSCKEKKRIEVKRDRVAILAKDYQKYIHSPEWIERAKKAKARALWRCQLCNAPQGDVTPDGAVMLNAHHRTYIRLGYERPEDIIVLCQKCHRKFHKELDPIHHLYSGI